VKRLNRANTLVGGVILGFVLGMGALYGLSRLNSVVRVSELMADPAASAKLQIDAVAPDFELETIYGERLSLSELRGKVVVVNFWATWCGPCQVEMPLFQERYEQYGGELAILAVNAQEEGAKARNFMEDLGLTFDGLLDPGGEVQELYLVRGYPTTYVIDRKGILRVQHVGVLDADQFDDYLESAGLRE
jgi:peroxiredoxin